ncbi:MAG TPA: hypothetical protein VJM81_06030 [Rhizorhapis sp.]|nr:hypothetical protein [Rhizorhapis sp.]
MREKRLPLAPARAVGRPRRLTLEAIVDAACEVGVANLDMGLVAERLNTGVATLYGYVKGRDHLLELVAERLAADSGLRDTGQSWQDIVWEHAAVTYALFQSQPQLITNLMGYTSYSGSVAYWNRLFDLLSSRGMTPEDAVDIYVEVNQVVIGAAVCLMRRNAIEERAAAGEGPAFNPPAVMGDYKRTLERIIAGYETRMQQKSDSVTEQ